LEIANGKVTHLKTLQLLQIYKQVVRRLFTVEFYFPYRIISLLESFSEATDIDVFFDALWQSVITTPAVRLAATIFLLSRLDKHLPPTEQQHLLGKNPAFMVSFPMHFTQLHLVLG
jgi:hypothetical protein